MWSARPTALKIWADSGTMTAIRSSLLLLLLFPASMVLSASSTVYASSFSESGYQNYFKVIWGLLVVLGIILILYGLLRKRFSLLHRSTKQEINILEMKPLMGKKALCLVQVRGKDLLLGISGDNISCLASFPSSPKSNFAEVLQDTSQPDNS